MMEVDLVEVVVEVVEVGRFVSSFIFCFVSFRFGKMCILDF